MIRTHFFDYLPSDYKLSIQQESETAWIGGEYWICVCWGVWDANYSSQRQQDYHHLRPIGRFACGVRESLYLWLLPRWFRQASLLHFIRERRTNNNNVGACILAASQNKFYWPGILFGADSKSSVALSAALLPATTSTSSIASRSPRTSSSIDTVHFRTDFVFGGGVGVGGVCGKMTVKVADKTGSVNSDARGSVQLSLSCFWAPFYRTYGFAMKCNDRLEEVEIIPPSVYRRYDGIAVLVCRRDGAVCHRARWQNQAMCWDLDSSCHPPWQKKWQRQRGSWHWLGFALDERRLGWHPLVALPLTAAETSGIANESAAGLMSWI